MPRRANSSPQTVKLLQALLTQADDWRYGYDLSKETGLKSGTLYPLLMRLETSSWLEAEWETTPQPGKPARHMYRLTTLGRQEAQAAIAQVPAAAEPVTLQPAHEEAP